MSRAYGSRRSLASRTCIVLAFGAFAAVPIVACGNGSPILLAPDLDASADGSGLPTGQGVGQPCDEANVCRPGLACVSGKCEPGHSSEDGTPCVISAECKQGSYCGPERKCAPAGSGAEGASCSSDADCMSGMRCNLVGFGAQCQPEGQGDVGAQCKLSGECFGGLACAKNVCTPLPPGTTPPLAIPTWAGVECKDDAGPVTAYFRVPRGNGDGDFFRLPFPNDARRAANGHPSMTGFPTPGPELLGFDVVDRYVKDVEQNADGFSAYPAVTMRFSGAVDFDSLKGAGAVRYVDLATGNDLGLYWAATTGRSAYVCENSLAIRPSTGSPLTPGGTYAVLVTNVAKATGGTAIQRAADLSALLAASAPQDQALSAAYAAYKPLRDWAATKSFDLATVVNASVFTVAHSTNAASKLATAVAGATVPTAKGWVKCGAAPSPCPDATGDRACGAADPAFDELHALVTLPIFQKGTAPYLTPEDGGDLAFDGSGTPTVQRTEDVCLSLTVPKGVAMPANGWPLVVYAHGTGGSFRSHVTEGVAKLLASVDDGGGGTVHMAVLGIDQVSHGPRRNGSKQSPNDLFFNFTNPLAARGNPLQGAADQMALVRFAGALDLAAGTSPTGAAIKFDQISFWGHSQGATEGGIAMPYVDNVRGAVLSGEGASLIDALLTKTSPVNIAATVPFVLVDPAGVSDMHPVLSVLQNSIDPADPLDHAKSIASAPITPALGKHVFVPFGQKDTYTPSKVQSTFVLAARLGLASSPAGVTPEAIGSLGSTPVPASLNLSTSSLTGFARQYAPSNYDGHFVVFRDAQAKLDASHFLADLSKGASPAVGR